LRVQAAQV